MVLNSTPVRIAGKTNLLANYNAAHLLSIIPSNLFAVPKNVDLKFFVAFFKWQISCLGCSVAGEK